MAQARTNFLARTLFGLVLAGGALVSACTETEGEPDAGPKACGGRGGPACGDDQFCNFPVSSECGVWDGPGVCTDKPEICTREYAPVCGCDGTTYGNACEARAAGVSTKTQGECAPAADAGTPEPDAGSTPDSGTPAFCGGFAGFQCPAPLYCNYPTSTNCGSGDQAGACETRPSICPAIYKPVCGCDGNSYSNACAAASAGVSILHDGSC